MNPTGDCFGDNAGLEAYVKSLFSMYADDTNTISRNSFPKLCLDLGYHLSPSNEQLAFDTIDRDNSNTIDFDEFFMSWKNNKKFKINTIAKLRLYRDTLEQFRKYDVDNSGKITLNDYKAIYSSFNKTEEELKAAIEVVDKSGTGEITLEDFVANWEL